MYTYVEWPKGVHMARLIAKRVPYGKDAIWHPFGYQLLPYGTLLAFTVMYAGRCSNRPDGQKGAIWHSCHMAPFWPSVKGHMAPIWPPWPWVLPSSGSLGKLWRKGDIITTWNLCCCSIVVGPPQISSFGQNTVSTWEIQSWGLNSNEQMVSQPASHPASQPAVQLASEPESQPASQLCNPMESYGSLPNPIESHWLLWDMKSYGNQWSSVEPYVFSCNPIIFHTIL